MEFLLYWDEKSKFKRWEDGNWVSLSPRVFFLRCTFYSTGSSLSSSAPSWFAHFAPSSTPPLLFKWKWQNFQMTEDLNFKRCIGAFWLTLRSSMLRKSGLSECIWVGSIKPNGNSNGKATVTTNKRKPILSFWGLQTLFLQKSRICSWHLPTQWFKINEKVSFYNNAKGSNVLKHSKVSIGFMRLFCGFSSNMFLLAKLELLENAKSWRWIN